MDGKISNFAQVAYLRRYTVTDGQEAGLRFLEANNGKLRFLLNESKALDIAQLWHEGDNVSFISKNGFTPREVPFLNRFEGGMLYTCGLDAVGEREGHDMHGSLHNTPAHAVKAECTQEGITVEAEILCGELFGKHLVLKRKIFTAIGSDTLEIYDTLENRAYRDEEYCLLYHVNIGYPMLDEGAKVIGEVKNVIPRTDWSKEHLRERELISPAIANQFEFCYFVEAKNPEFTLVNEKLKKSFTLAWSGDTLPHLIQWKSMACGDYALGFEPCTTFIDDKFAFSTIKAQSKVEFALKMTVAKN